MKYLKYIPLFLGLLATPLPALDTSLDGAFLFVAQQRVTIYRLYIGFRGKDYREVYGKWESYRVSGYNEFQHLILEETPEVQRKFTGEIISGDPSKGKIEIKFSGDVPYEEVSKKSGRLWTISPDPVNRNHRGIEVPMMIRMSGETFESSLTFQETYEGGD
jgi:hypothetical protein